MRRRVSCARLSALSRLQQLRSTFKWLRFACPYSCCMVHAVHAMPSAQVLRQRPFTHCKHLFSESIVRAVHWPAALSRSVGAARLCGGVQHCTRGAAEAIGGE